jgi:short-subunit dehydrogenase
MNITNKIIVVTGAGSGIGKEVALALLVKGAKIAAVDLRENSLQELKEAAGNKANCLSLHVLNISDKQVVEALPEKVINQQGRVDGVINCAGIIQPFVRINNLDYDAIDRVMNVNFYGTLYMVKAFLPYLLEQPEAHIVNVSSMGGFLPVPGQSVYGASKAAVKLLTEGLYAELADTNVKVSVVFPGATQTNITQNSGVEGPKNLNLSSDKQNIKMLSAKEAANQIIKGIESNRFQIFLGKDSKMMNMIYRISPKYATNLIAKKMRSLLA